MLPFEPTNVKSRKRDTNEENSSSSPLNNKDNPLIYLNINKFNIRQYKDANGENFEKEVMSDTIAFKHNLKGNTTLEKFNSNATNSDSKHNKESNERLLSNILDKFSTSHDLPSRRMNSGNESLQSPTNISRNNISIKCDPENTEKNVSEIKYRRVLNAENVTNEKEGQDNGIGLSDITETRDSIPRRPRLCYACNSIHDPSCWSPGRRTAVKYCRREHQFCLAHLYVHDGNYMCE